MSHRIPKIMELLHRKEDCCNCGHCTCEVYAMELLAGRVTVEACPTITSEARRMLSEALRMEERALSSLKGFLTGDLKEVFTNVLMLSARISGLLLIIFPFLAVLWLISIWFMMK